MRRPVRFDRATPLLLLAICVLGACSSASDETAELDWSGRGLLALIDADMAATAYADGKLHPIEGARDELVRIDPQSGRIVWRTPVPNTVMGWPGSMVLSPDGRLAYVVSSRGSPAKGTQTLDDVYGGMPIERTLTAIETGNGSITAQINVCRKPLSVDIAPGGAFLVIACGDDSNELTVVPLLAGQPQPPRAFDLDIASRAARPSDAGATYAVIHPGGERVAAILQNRTIADVMLDMDAGGVPEDAVVTDALETDRWLSVARWSESGAHLIVSDTGWGPRATDAVFNGPGEVLSISFGGSSGSPRYTSVATVSKSPEAIELNRKKDTLVVVNMERTYLPGGLLSLVPGRSASSLSLLSFEDEGGTLTTLGRPVQFRGVLPEDAVFDRDTSSLAVGVFQDHGAPRSGGWIEFFEIDGNGPARRPVPAGKRIALPRGVHDLAVID